LRNQSQKSLNLKRLCGFCVVGGQFCNVRRESSPRSGRERGEAPTGERYNRDVNDEIAHRLTEYFRPRSEGLAAVYLYGSVARGTAGPDSDVDVGVLFTRNLPSTLDSQPYDIEADLERVLGRPVQVVELNRAPVDLRTRVLRDGRLLVDFDRSARIRFEVQTRNEAFDLEPILRRYRSTPGRGR
jgi:uncharacterized protein